MNIGIDLTNIKRKEFKSLKFAKRFCTENEFQQYLEKPNKLSQKKYLASIWAIKEAVLKATNKQIGIHEINIQKTNNGPKFIHHQFDFSISLTYEDKYVIAVVIANKKKDKYE